MDAEIRKLKEKIARMEEIMDKNKFGGLLDKSKTDLEYKKLVKLRKQLKKLEENK